MRFVLRRLLIAPITLLGVATLVFSFLQLVPGDPVDAMLGESAAPVDRQALRVALGLDRPVLEQYGAFLGGALRGDLGRSLSANTPVASLVLARVPATASLAAAAALIAVAIALPLGVVAAAWRGTWIDTASTAFALGGASLPNFFLGPLLVLLFSIALEWLPVSGSADASSLVLPAVTLGLGMSAILTRLTRSAVLDALSADFIRTARAKGLPEFRVLARHALRNACLPVVTVLGMQIGGLLGGAIVTETIFAWPGVGRLTLEAIQSRDVPLVQGCVLLIAVTTLLVNLLTDVAYAWLDPRIRIGDGDSP
jgi:peptide/nickel transport system permease protein